MFKFHQSIDFQLEGCISICLDFTIEVVSKAFENEVEFFYSPFSGPQLTVIHRLRFSGIERFILLCQRNLPKDYMLFP